jgi:hypothetical protein
MEHRLTLVLAVAGLAFGCGQERALPYKEPPVNSYKTEAHRVKIGETAVSVPGATVTAEFFQNAEIRPFVGRFFVDGDFLSLSRPVVVLSHDLWVERFASSPGVIGQAIEIDERRATVLGVMPPGFTFPQGTQLWTPKRNHGAP